MKLKPDKHNRKRVYEKPKLRKIQIVEGQQTLGQGCKLEGSGINIGDMSSCTQNNCNQPGT